jgi:hypothetical protein
MPIVASSLSAQTPQRQRVARVAKTFGRSDGVSLQLDELYGVMNGLLFVLTRGKPIAGLFSVQRIEPPIRITSDGEGVYGAAK